MGLACNLGFRHLYGLYRLLLILLIKHLVSISSPFLFFFFSLWAIDTRGLYKPQTGLISQVMAYSSSRPTSAVLASTSTSSSIRQQSNLNAISHQQSLALSSRIVSKKAELENLMRLRDLSGAMAMQMQVLETKISTLRDGTEAMACVLANWDNVLRAISMASTKAAVSISKKDQSSSVESGQNLIVEQRLPVTLVRIPAEEQERPHD